MFHSLKGGGGGGGGSKSKVKSHIMVNTLRSPAVLEPLGFRCFFGGMSSGPGESDSPGGVCMHGDVPSSLSLSLPKSNRSESWNICVFMCMCAYAYQGIS